MLVGSLGQDSHGLGVLAFLHEGELVLSEDILVHNPSVAEDGLVHVLQGVHGGASASQGQALHVAPELRTQFQC